MKRIMYNPILTDENLRVIYDYSTKPNRDKYLPYLNKYWSIFRVDTADRQSAFLAQVGHESGQLRYSEEVASGKAYEGRKDLGNTMPGDGVKFKGRGLIQVTGRSNYKLFDEWLHKNNYLNANQSLLVNPEIVSNNPEIAVLSAFWYWELHKLNNLADRPK